MKRYLTLILFSVFALCCCDNKTDVYSKKQNQITLIFIKSPDDSFYRLKRNGFAVLADFKLKYFDDSGLPRLLNPKSGGQPDTIVISSSRSLLEIQHMHSGLDFLSFFLKNGDTVLFRYNNNFPQAEVANRKTKQCDLNFEEKKKGLFINDFYPSIKYMYPMLFIPGFIQKSRSQQIQIQDLVFQAIKTQNQSENRLLDSLNKSGLMSDDIYALYKKKVYFSLKTLQVTHKEFDKEDVIKVLSNTNDS